MEEIRYYVAYEDKGPSGPCGQITSVTSPCRKLYIFKSEKTFKEFIKKVTTKPSLSRIRPRIIGYWSNAPDYDSVVEESD